MIKSDVTQCDGCLVTIYLQEYHSLIHVRSKGVTVTESRAVLLAITNEKFMILIYGLSCVFKPYVINLIFSQAVT